MPNGIGIYIGRKHVVVATVEKNGDTYRLRDYAVEPIVPDEGSSSTASDKKISGDALAIQNAAKRVKISRAFARIAISPFYVVTRYFIMPSLPAKEKDEAIQYEASRYTRLKLTESVFGYHEYVHVQNVSAVTANAVKKRQIQLTALNARRAGISLDAIEPEYIAFSRTAAYFGLQDFKKPQCLVWFDSDQSVSLTLVSKGIVFLSHDFRLSGDAAADHDKFHDELMGAARYLAENAGGFALELFVLSGFGSLEEQGKKIQELFPAAEVQVLRHPLNEGAAPDDSGAIAIALGLALGDAGWKSSIADISLLPKEDRKMKPHVFYPLLAATIGAVAFIFLVIQLAVVLPLCQSALERKTIAEKPLKFYGSIYSQSLSDLQARARRLASRNSILESFDQARIPSAEVLKAAIKSLPKSMWLRQIEMSPSGGGVRAEGKKDSNKKSFSFWGYCYLGKPETEAKEVNKWVQGLAKDPVFSKWFSHLSLEEVKQEKVLGRMVTRFWALAEKA